MNLPDFLSDPVLNGLRQKMGGAPVCAFPLTSGRPALSVRDLAALSGEGIEVSSEAIRILADGTFAYRDRRVVLYIREASLRGGEGGGEPEERSLPRFHVARCRALRVCKNCLAAFDWQGFQSASGSAEREKGVSGFVLRDFFERYGRQILSGSG